MTRKYEPNVVEPKWQKTWEDTAAGIAHDDVAQKFYCLDMFPYPSANGLHVGHPEGYTATDIVSRYQRMQGKNVLHPMGWDAFGLPAENYAIKTGVHPDESTHNNIKNFTRQIKELGFSYDWQREIDTSSPEYYKWTQWMFLQMFKHDLAYRKKAKANWCEQDQTVLANEQVVDGKCERCHNPVIQKELEQWFFKTTVYAEQLLNDLDTIDWPEPIKLMQRNWIGKSEGAEIDFAIKDVSEKITVFTTRPDTLYGATYIVLAPEHALVQSITTIEQKTAVEHYLVETKKKNDLQRTDLNKEKTGAFTGAYALNPATGQEIPIWIADYVLATYGTGAIMAVPAHDDRDKEFAQKYSLPSVVSEGTPWSEIEKIGARRKVRYKLRDWLISRQRYWGAPIPIVYDPAGQAHPVKEDHLPLLLPTDVDYRPKGTSPLGSSAAYKALAEKLYGEGWHFEVDTMDTFVCSSWYYLRYCDPHNDKIFAAPEKLQQWLPVDLYVGGAEHAVLHLLYARFFHKALQDFGYIPTAVGREPFKALRNQGMILGEDHQKMSKSRGNVVNPDEVVAEYGADTLRLYEMFMGPFEDVKPWDTQSIKGVYRFLIRIWEIISCIIDDQKNNKIKKINSDQKLLHKTIKKVTEDIENFHFNTAISQLMILLNGENSQPKWRNKLIILERGENGEPIKWQWQDVCNVGENVYDPKVVEILLTLLSPFAPHITEELWQQLGHTQSITQQAWPSYNEDYLVEDEVTIAVQVNGKLRDTMVFASNVDEVIVKSTVQTSEKVKKYTEGKEIIKVIYVPKKLVSIVVK